MKANNLTDDNESTHNAAHRLREKLEWFIVNLNSR